MNPQQRYELPATGRRRATLLLFAHSPFLKKPPRIMALVMIRGLALLVYALAERLLCQALVDNKETEPDQKGRPT